MDVDILRARGIQIVDDHGTVRAEIGTNENGRLQFNLMDKGGAHRIVLAISEAGLATATIYDAELRAVLQMAVHPEGNPLITVNDGTPDGEAVVLAIDSTHGPVVGIQDSRGGRNLAEG